MEQSLLVDLRLGLISFEFQPKPLNKSTTDDAPILNIISGQHTASATTDSLQSSRTANFASQATPLGASGADRGNPRHGLCLYSIPHQPCFLSVDPSSSPGDPQAERARLHVWRSPMGTSKLPPLGPWELKDIGNTPSARIPPLQTKYHVNRTRLGIMEG